MLHKAKSNLLLSGLQVSPHFSITHQFFVDDVMLFGPADVVEWTHMWRIIQSFCKCSFMCINEGKSKFLKHKLDNEKLKELNDLLPFTVADITEGTYYLGYFLKPNDYRVGDWH